MSFEELSEILPLPDESGVPEDEVAWAKMQGQIGLSFPTDYRRFISRLGPGCIDQFIWVYSPFSRNQFLNLLSRLDRVIEAFKVLKEDPNDLVPFRLFPESGGLFPWGSTNNGDFLFWRMNGERDQWSIVVAESREPVYREYNMSMTTFLARLLSKEIVCDLFPEEFPLTKHLFVSGQDNVVG